MCNIRGNLHDQLQELRQEIQNAELGRELVPRAEEILDKAITAAVKKAGKEHDLSPELIAKIIKDAISTYARPRHSP
jgi:hypothetical protein